MESDRFRIGLGTDLHRLEEGLPLVVGGVEVVADRGAVGHSDADAALHALADALLGAIAEGDIGELFPDHSAEIRGLDSSVIVAEAMTRVARRGYRVVNADLVVELQRPKLLPQRAAIRARIASLLEVAAERVGFKAKTGEGVGPVGRGEAIAARAVVLLAERDDDSPQ